MKKLMMFFREIGGKWVKKLKAHQFPYDPAPLFNAVLESKELPPKNPTAFYPTPKAVVDLMIDAVDLQCRWDETRILEPSAGTGAIVRAANNLKAELEREWKVDCCEILGVNRTALMNEGFNLVGDDFLSYNPADLYDVILMNPPFSLEGDKTAYITHVEHAWKLLEERGSFAAIVPGGWLYGSTKKLSDFREFVCDSLDFEEIGSGAFKESGTMVNTFLIYGNKMNENWRTEPYNGWCSHHAWNAGLWIDNDFELYQRVQRIKDREAFNQFCDDVVRKLLRDHLPCVLRSVDRDALWNYYNEQS